jgi:hypothetical protein
MPELGGLLLECGDQMRMAVAERGDGDAAGEVEISLALVGNQPHALSSLEPQWGTRVGIIKRRGFSHGAISCHSLIMARNPAKNPSPEIKNAAFRRRGALFTFRSAMSTKLRFPSMRQARIGALRGYQQLMLQK